MPLVSTSQSHVQRAIDFTNNYRNNLWIGIAKSSVWGTPDVAPVYDPVNHPENNILWDPATITEIIGYKRADTVILVKQDTNGPIEVIDEQGIITRWTQIDESTAKANNARFVFISGWLDNTLPSESFRRIGIYSGLIRAQGVVAKDYLLPLEVQSNGTLELIQNHNVQYRTLNSRQKLAFIYEF